MPADTQIRMTLLFPADWTLEQARGIASLLDREILEEQWSKRSRKIIIEVPHEAADAYLEWFDDVPGVRAIAGAASRP